MKSEMIQNELEMFKATGFFAEKAIAIQHIKDFTLNDVMTFLGESNS